MVLCRMTEDDLSVLATFWVLYLREEVTYDDGFPHDDGFLTDCHRMRHYITCHPGPLAVLLLLPLIFLFKLGNADTSEDEECEEP